MKTYNYRSGNALLLLTTCLLFLGGNTVSQANSDVLTRRVAVTGPAFAPVEDGARLIVRRIPNLGNWVFVDLYVDGVAAGGIGYGHTYEGLLRPGRHVLSALPGPNANWPIPFQVTLDVRKGQTYAFTAMGDDSGHLILKADSTPTIAASDNGRTNKRIGTGFRK